MSTCDCNHDKHWHKGHPGGHNYDPKKHHHPHPHPFEIDKCADQCDDQLPLFSQVGRGLQGDGYKVDIIKDGLTETILEGLFYDPRTGAYTSDWISENINGGHLSYQYNLRPFTDPQTFTITFKYVRPGRNADENGTVWSWTTPAIPYLWSRQEDGSMSDGEDIVGTGVATLYLKKTTEAEWDWHKHEKLVYPDGFTHEDMNAPDPLEGWTVNLTYGIGGDIDAPNIDDIAKIIGITPENIRDLVQNSAVPTDTFPGNMNTKQYIDWKDDQLQDQIDDLTGAVGNIKEYDVKSAKPAALDVTSATAGKKTTFTLTPAAPAAGPGIKVTEGANGKVTITNNITAGPGIKIVKKSDGSMQIQNTTVASDFQKLVPGQDFTVRLYGGWYFGEPQSSGAQQQAPSDKKYPDVYAIPTYDDNGNVIAARISIQHNTADNRALVNGLNMKTRSNFMFRHASDAVATNESQIFGISFAGDYAALNNLNVANINSNNIIWNIQGTNDGHYSDNAHWVAPGASWPVVLGVSRDTRSNQKKFLVTAVSIGDGYNGQYDTPNYKDSSGNPLGALCTRPWANLALIFDLI